MLLIEGLHGAGPMLALGVVVLAGWAFGALARRFHLPSVTGQIVAGVVIGKAGFDLFGDETLEDLQPLTHFALGLIAVTVGAHLNLKRLRNAGKRLSLIFLTEATLVPLAVFAAVAGLGGGVLGLHGGEPGNALLFATAAVATAPATIVAIVRETNSKGVFVKTLVAAVALNNLACILLFEVARELPGASDGSLLAGLLIPLRQLLVAGALGTGLALTMAAAARWTARTELLATSAALCVLLASGLSELVGVSPLLSCLFLGLVQTNVTKARDTLIDEVFADFVPVILVVFFTLAGMHLSFGSVAVSGVLALLLFAARIGGKLVSGRVAMTLARAPKLVRANLGLALVPQAGVAIGLVVILQDDPRHALFADVFTAVVLTVVTVNEIVGPILTKIALTRSGEIGKDGTRLLDFLQEENIAIDFQASDKHDAIARLVDQMIASHHLEDVDGPTLLNSVLTREAQASTCLGGGLSVPHCILPDGHPMVGVMGISRTGLAFETPDGLPVRCIVLLGTSADERDRHLQVLATLARTVGGDPVFQAQLFNAKSPAHASALLHGDESEGFNYFLAGD